MTPVDRFINTLTLQTYAWIEAGAQQVRQWREEDENNGIIWNQSPREPAQPNKRAGSISR